MSPHRGLWEMGQRQVCWKYHFADTLFIPPCKVGLPQQQGAPAVFGFLVVFKLEFFRKCPTVTALFQIHRQQLLRELQCRQSFMYRQPFQALCCLTLFKTGLHDMVLKKPVATNACPQVSQSTFYIFPQQPVMQPPQPFPAHTH